MTSDALTERQHVALRCLVAGESKGDAAKAAGVHPSTLSRWLRLDAFSDALAGERFSATAHARMRLALSMTEAVDVLAEIASDPTASASARLRAACAILDRGGLPRATRATATLYTPSDWKPAEATGPDSSFRDDLLEAVAAYGLDAVEEALQGDHGR